jgi:hypothetical protein
MAKKKAKKKATTKAAKKKMKKLVKRAKPVARKKGMKKAAKKTKARAKVMKKTAKKKTTAVKRPARPAKYIEIESFEVITTAITPPPGLAEPMAESAPAPQEPVEDSYADNGEEHPREAEFDDDDLDTEPGTT